MQTEKCKHTHQRISLVLFHTFIIVNKSHEKTLKQQQELESSRVSGGILCQSEWE